MKLNKKANIPVIILVMGVVILCGLAILSFSISSQNTKKAFSDVFIVEEIKIQKEKLNVYGELGETNLVQGEILLKSDVEGKYLEIRKGNVRVKYYVD